MDLETKAKPRFLNHEGPRAWSIVCINGCLSIIRGTHVYYLFNGACVLWTPWDQS